MVIYLFEITVDIILIKEGNYLLGNICKTAQPIKLFQKIRVAFLLTPFRQIPS